MAFIGASSLLLAGSNSVAAQRRLPAACGRASLSGWRPAGPRFRPLPDRVAAACVSRTPELVPANAPFNRYTPTAAQLHAWLTTQDSWHRTPLAFNPYYAYVTGDFRGTTDEIIQWAAAKWGIPVNWLRAQYAQESVWRQRMLGDLTDVGAAWYDLYPPQARVAGTTEVYETMGISQIKWAPNNSVGAGTEPLRWESTAFAADYQAATVRFYFDDPDRARSRWGDASYRPRQAWNSMAAWFDPYPWGNKLQRWYVHVIGSQLAKHSWTKPYFR
jgi:hypothetical protein